MKVERILVTHAATIKTADFENHRLEITWEAVLDVGESAVIQTPLLMDKLYEEISTQEYRLRAEHGQDNYAAQPTARPQPAAPGKGLK